jgi:trehalose-phosphatase
MYVYRQTIDFKDGERTVTPEAQEKAAQEKLDRFFAGFASASRPVLLLDYDGTLSAFRVDRFTARPYAGVREALTSIQRQGRTRMAVITGRPAHEIAPLLGLDPPLEAWGLHGAERLYPDGRRELEQASADTQARLEELKQKLRRDALGGLFEDKANGAVMHWRGKPHKVAQHIERRTRALFEPLAQLDGLSLLDFEAGLELRVGRVKGGAVAAILAEESPTSPVAFLGDDLSDEAAFQVVRPLGDRGLSALVRPAWRETDAEIWLRPPQEVLSFLVRWAKSLETAR